MMNANYVYVSFHMVYGTLAIYDFTLPRKNCVIKARANFTL